MAREPAARGTAGPAAGHRALGRGPRRPDLAEVCRRFGVDRAGAARRPRPAVHVRGPSLHPGRPDRGRRRRRAGVDPLRRLLPPAPAAEPPGGPGAGAAPARPCSRVPGADPDGALARALAKLETVLGVGADDAVDVELGPVSPGSAGRRSASGRGPPPGSSSTTTPSAGTTAASRVVQPWRVFNAHGQWYLAGWCDQAGDERLFRVDRISRAECWTRRSSRRPEAAGATDVFHPRPTTPSSCSTWTRRPTGSPSSTPTKGSRTGRTAVLRVRLRVSERAWLERLLLRGGSGRRRGRGRRPRSGAAAAARLLDRYRAVSESVR